MLVVVGHPFLQLLVPLNLLFCNDLSRIPSRLYRYFLAPRHHKVYDVVNNKPKVLCEVLTKRAYVGFILCLAISSIARCSVAGCSEG